MASSGLLPLVMLLALGAFAAAQECSSGGRCNFANCASLGRAPCPVDCGEEARFCFGKCMEGARKGICFGLSRCKRVCKTQGEAGRVVTRCRCEAPPPKCTCHVFDYTSLVDPAASKLRTPEPEMTTESVSVLESEPVDGPRALSPGNEAPL